MRIMPKAIELFLASQNEALAYKTKWWTRKLDSLARLAICSEYRKWIKEVKLADKPGFVGFIAKADSHSSRRTITCALKQPTRWQREPRLIYLRKNASLFGLAADGGYRVSP